MILNFTESSNLLVHSRGYRRRHGRMRHRQRHDGPLTIVLRVIPTDVGQRRALVKHVGRIRLPLHIPTGALAALLLVLCTVTINGTTTSRRRVRSPIVRYQADDVLRACDENRGL